MTQYSIHIYAEYKFFCLYKPGSPLAPGFDSTIEFLVWFLEGENDTAAMRGRFRVSLTSWRNETTLQEFPLKKSNPREQIRGSGKKNIPRAFRASARRGVPKRSTRIPHGEKSRYISEPLRRNMRWKLLNCRFPAD